MTRSQTRLLGLMLALPLLVLFSALLYMQGMARLEGSPRDLWSAIEFTAETLTTTGYGADASWSHPLMVVFVVTLQFIGVFFVFLIFPIYLVPFLEERFEERLPRKARPDLRNHVIVYRYGPAVEMLLDQLARQSMPILVVETDEPLVRSLVEREIPAVFSRGGDDVLRICNLEHGRALIANARDEENAAFILRARQLGFSGDVYALVEEPVHRRPMELAGANYVYTPRHILAAALAARASDRISPRISGIQQLGDRLQLRELRIHPGSELAGRRLVETGIGARTGVTVIGQWVGGRLLTQPHAETRLEPRSILIVVGSPEGLTRLATMVQGATPLRREGPFVVAGFGEVGQKVHQLLTDAGEEVRSIDRVAHPGVDQVGNVLDPSVLEQAGIDRAQAVVLALDSDDSTLFATVIARDLSAEVPLIARVNEASNVENIHRAGADFALSISQVSGQMLSHRLLGQESLTVDTQLRVLKVAGESLQGRHPSDLAIRQRTLCSVVAVERGKELLVEIDPGFEFEATDSIYVCGSDAGLRTFLEQYPAEPRG